MKKVSCCVKNQLTKYFTIRTFGFCNVVLAFYSLDKIIKFKSGNDTLVVMLLYQFVLTFGEILMLDFC